MHRTHTLSAFLVLAAAAAWALAAAADELPTAVRGGQVVTATIDPAGDVDAYAIPLFPNDLLTVTVKDSGAVRGLVSTLSLTKPDGEPASPTIKANGSRRPKLTYRATDEGAHVLTLVGDPGQFTGSAGGYTAQFTVKRAKPAKGTFGDAAGGAISYRFPATDGAKVTLTARTRKGGFDLQELRRPDGTPEAGFAAALKAAKNRRSARVKGLLLTGSTGDYEVTGAYDAGSAVSITAAVKHDERKRARPLSPEPRFDALLTPFPDRGIVGTPINVPGQDFTYVPVPGGEDVFPRFWVGETEIARADIERPNGAIFRFPAPPGLVARESYDITVENADGQRARLADAFTVIPPPTATGITAIDGGAVQAGPAGGRHLRISGQDFRSGTVVLFGTTLAQPSLVLSTRIDVTAPQHVPAYVTVTVRDEYGQRAECPDAFLYADVPSNRVTSIDLPFLQALGGETVVVSGADFVADTVLTFDGDATNAVRDSATRMHFTAPVRSAGTAEIRVTDDLEQTSDLHVTVAGFDNATTTAVPAPVTTSGEVDGWRGSRILVADVNGDTRLDVVLLQASQVTSTTANRSRVRVLLQDSSGNLNDATSSWMPAVAGDEDWRARDGVIVDLDGDQKPDLAIVTDEQVSSGTRSSLRLLRNTGSAFSDRTSSWAPALTTYGDVNQGVAIAAVGADLAIVHTSSFTETVITVISAGDPQAVPPIPPTIRTDVYDYSALRLLRNDGTGKLTRATGSVPAVSGSDPQQYQGDALVAGDADGNGSIDLVLTRAVPPGDGSGGYLRALRVLANTNGNFTDVSDTALPAASDPEFFQGSRLVIADLTGDGVRDILVLSASALTSPSGGGTPTTSLRLLVNGGSGTFTAATSAFPAPSGSEYWHGTDIAIGDLDGAGNPDIVLVSSYPPEFGGRACRVLRAAGSAWVDASAAFPTPLAGDDGHGAAVGLIDLAGDGDPDIVLTKNDADESVRNTRVFVNPRR